jgi:hypothetical protein
LAFGDTAAWSLGAGQVSNSIVYKCDATDEVANLYIPIMSMSHLPNAQGVATKGEMITKIGVDYEIVTAACDAVTPHLYKNKRGVNGAVVVVTEITGITYDAAHNTDDERDDLDQHKMEITIDDPSYLEDDEYLWLVIAFDKAATSTVEYLGSFIYHTLKV